MQPPNMATLEAEKHVGRVLILSGPPGSGKTTIGRIIADTADRPTVHLATDGFYTCIRKGFVLPFLPDAAQQNEVVIGVLVSSLLGYARGGYDVVVDGIIGPWSIEPFIHGTTEAAVQLQLVVLRPSLDQVMERAKGREGRELIGSGPIKGLYQAFEKLGGLEPFVVNTTPQSVEESVQEVRRCFLAQEYRLA
ncbi:MAG: AAA family ATPase [Acidobacteriota bacterium]